MAKTVRDRLLGLIAVSESYPDCSCFDDAASFYRSLLESVSVEEGWLNEPPSASFSDILTQAEVCAAGMSAFGQREHTCIKRAA